MITGIISANAARFSSASRSRGTAVSATKYATPHASPTRSVVRSIASAPPPANSGPITRLPIQNDASAPPSAARSIAADDSGSRPSPSLLPQPCRLQYRNTNSISAPPIRMPGPKPAMNSSPIETSADTPYRIIGIDGGMTTPSSALDACNAAAQLRG
jgi:hypothetical protein